MVVCHLGDDDPEVLSMRTGSDGVGATTVETGESASDATFGRVGHCCIGTQGFLFLMGLVGETAAVLRILGYCVLVSFHFRTFLLSAPG